MGINNKSSGADSCITNASVLPDANVTDACSLPVAELTDAIKQLADTLSSSLAPPNELTLLQASLAVFIVVIGAFSAYFFNHLHWRMVAKKQKLSGVCLALSTLTSDLESVAVNYWLREYNKKDQLEIQAAEISIKTNILLISIYTKLIISQLNNKLSASEKQKFEDFPLEIFDLATGDGFESISKISSKTKAMKISTLCSNIKASILSLDFRN